MVIGRRRSSDSVSPHFLNPIRYTKHTHTHTHTNATGRHLPVAYFPSSMSSTTPIVKPPLPPEIEELHEVVVAAGQETYTDPTTGYMVMSGLYHTYVMK